MLKEARGGRFPRIGATGGCEKHLKWVLGTELRSFARTLLTFELLVQPMDCVLFFFFLRFILYGCIWVCVCVCGALRCQKRALGPLEMELQVALSHPLQVLGSECSVSGVSSKHT